MIIVLVMANFYSAGPQASHRLNALHVICGFESTRGRVRPCSSNITGGAPVNIFVGISDHMFDLCRPLRYSPRSFRGHTGVDRACRRSMERRRTWRTTQRFARPRWPIGSGAACYKQARCKLNWYVDDHEALTGQVHVVRWNSSWSLKPVRMYVICMTAVRLSWN